MQKKKLDKEELFSITTIFRTAIIKAKQNGEFNKSDRMSNFPFGCCDDSCDLLAYYLYDEFQILTEQRNGVYRDDDPMNTVNHVWLIVNNIIC